MITFKTSGEAHDALIAAIDYELDHYGPASLADLIATVLDSRYERFPFPCKQCGWRAMSKYSLKDGLCCRCRGCTCFGPGPNPSCPAHPNGW